MLDMNKHPENLLDLARNKGLIRPCDLAPLGIPRVSLTRAVRGGQLERVGRGLYGLPGRVVSAHGSLSEVSRKVPKGIVCLLSALRFYNLTTQAPYEVWLAVENKAVKPKLDYPRKRYGSRLRCRETAMPGNAAFRAGAGRATVLQPWA